MQTLVVEFPEEPRSPFLALQLQISETRDVMDICLQPQPADGDIIRVASLHQSGEKILDHLGHLRARSDAENQQQQLAAILNAFVDASISLHDGYGLSIDDGHAEMTDFLEVLDEYAQPLLHFIESEVLSVLLVQHLQEHFVARKDPFSLAREIFLFLEFQGNVREPMQSMTEALPLANGLGLVNTHSRLKSVLTPVT